MSITNTSTCTHGIWPKVEIFYMHDWKNELILENCLVATTNALWHASHAYMIFMGAAILLQ